ncbi:MAG: plasmid pRiA4b ORF-3 family protein [Sphingomonadaceae bacterium]
MGAEFEIVQLKVRLLGISPMIWRRVLVPIDMTLRELHGVFQVAMGWEGIHLYAFDIRAVQYGAFELSMADPRTPLSQFGFHANDKFTYTYDMGDGWVHEVRVEKFNPAEPKKSWPLCIGGSGACPPEECGGPRGFLERREEADGYDAWQDMHAMLHLLSEATNPDADDEMLHSLLDDDVRMTLDRVLARQAYLSARFSRKDVNRAFQEGRHRELMHQQM